MVLEGCCPNNVLVMRTIGISLSDELAWVMGCCDRSNSIQVVRVSKRIENLWNSSVDGSWESKFAACNMLIYAICETLFLSGFEIFKFTWVIILIG